MNKGIKVMEEIERKSDNSQLSLLNKRRRNPVANIPDADQSTNNKKLKLDQSESGYAVP